MPDINNRKQLEPYRKRLRRYENVRAFEDLEGVLSEIRTTLSAADAAGTVPPEAWVITDGGT